MHVVNDRYAGRRAVCRDCGATYQIPDTLQAAPQSPANNTYSLVGLESGPPVAAVKAPSLPPRSCPSCRASCDPKAVLCVSCGYDFRSGKNLATRILPAAAAPRRDPKDRPSADARRKGGIITLTIFGIGAPLLPLFGYQFTALNAFGEYAFLAGLPCGIAASLLWYHYGRNDLGIATIVGSVFALGVAIAVGHM
jgi:hypothetical protein